MKHRLNYLMAILALTVSSCTCRNRAISPDLLSRLGENVYQSEEDFLSEDILSVVRDSSVVFDTSMTYRVPSTGITDQMRSGRCWLFSTLNILRAEVYAEYGEEFYFSQTYGQFYDILEKSNRFLENVIDNRKRPMSSRKNEWLFKKPIGDGGQFTNAAHLIDKYGVVPIEVMPERYSSTDNKRLMTVVLTLLRRYGLELRDADASEVQTVKEQALSDIYRLLTACLGIPPETFEWRGETFTPLSFRDRYVRHDMENEYAVFMNIPTRKFYRMYKVADNRNCYEYADWTFMNVPMAEIVSMGVESLRNGRMFYVSADTEHDNLDAEGIYDTRTFTSLDSKLGIHTSMTKMEQVASCESRSVHAIAVCGVRLDADGNPEAWLVENSYGLGRGDGGYVTFSNDWFMKYLYRAVFEKGFVKDDLLSGFDSMPRIIPSWNPNF